jgi:hypothetical protein
MPSTRTPREELESRKWGICSTDQKTLEKMFEVFYSLGLLGPIHEHLLIHSLFKNRPQKRYNVPFVVVEYLSKNRKEGGYEFFAFYKLSITTPWNLYREGSRMHSETLGKFFSGPDFTKHRLSKINTVVAPVRHPK